MKIFAGFTDEQADGLLLAYLAGVLFAVMCAILGAFLLYQTFLSIKKPRTKKGFNRRKLVLIIWVILLIGFGSYALSLKFALNQGKSYNRQLALGYAEIYDHPVILIDDRDYTIVFGEPWAQLEIYSRKEPAFNIIQVPLTELGKQYFNPEKGYCDFYSMRQNWDILTRRDETCEFLAQSGEFNVFASSENKFYATYKDIALEITPRDNELLDLVGQLRVTDKNELKQVISGPRFNDGAYINALDRWHKEGKFKIQ